MSKKGLVTGKCQVCRHEHVSRIDWLLATGAAGVRAIANQFPGLNYHALHRHGKLHISDRYKAAVRVGSFRSEDELRKLCAEAGTSSLQNMRALHNGHYARWLVALEAGDDKNMIAHGYLMLEAQRAQAKISGEAMPAPSSVTNNFFLTEDWLHGFTHDLLHVVRKHPEVKADIMKLLKSRLTVNANDPKLIEQVPRVVSSR
jgi:hypothetical protein